MSCSPLNSGFALAHGLPLSLVGWDRMCSEASPLAPRSAYPEPFVMSGSCRAQDAGPAVILAVACPAPTGCPPSPLAGLCNQVPHFGVFVAIAAMAKAVCEVFHIVALRLLAVELARGEFRLAILRHCAGAAAPAPRAATRLPRRRAA
jgi:hypothetical protein